MQKVEARAFGNCDTLYLVQSRGFGKTWLVAICCIAMAILYPGSLIAVVSGTAEQATLVLKKIDDYFCRNENIMREIEPSNRNTYVRINQAKGVCKFKNGSKIESYSIGTFRGNRAKIIVIDEAPEVKQVDLDAIVKPVRNCTRDNCVQFGIKDYASKMVSITSACLKSNYFYTSFVNMLKSMSEGDKTCFACALNYQSAVRCGISPAEFFEKEKRDMPESKFAMEYDSIFIGAEAGSVFPYELTDKCRTLKNVEVAMPARSGADYVMAVDLATSSASGADNAVIVIIKLVEQENGGYLKQLVFIRSYHGKRLDYMANEVRKLLVKFPNISKVVVDCRGVGDAFPQFMSRPWTDPESNKEYPPIVRDDEASIIHGAVPLLRPVMATMLINQQMVSALTIALEQESLELPISSHFILGNKIVKQDDESEETEMLKSLTMEEKAIYIETDALQVELGNIVGRHTAAGSVVYDSAKSTQHKDRYSALGYGIWYISGLEEMRKKMLVRGNGQECIGIVTTF